MDPDTTSRQSAEAVTAAAQILNRWLTERERRPLDRLVTAELRSRKNLHSLERRWAGDAVFGVVRSLRRLDTILLKAAGKPTAQALVEQWRQVGASTAGLPAPEAAAEYLRVTLSFSDSMASELEQILGSEALAAAEAFNQPARVSLRVNALKATRDEILSSIPGAAPGAWSPWAVNLPGRMNLYELARFRKGEFEVQEEASQLMSLLCNVQPGQTFVEMGAGAGGKSLAVAAMMQREGRIVAIDSSARKLFELQRRAHRAGVAGVETHCVPANSGGEHSLMDDSGKRLRRLRRSADVALLDAPCSGSGVLRRSPDRKWVKMDLQALAHTQLMLLKQAAGFVREGGHLIYVTCSFNRIENEQVVEQFLSENSQFAAVPALDRIDAAIKRIGGDCNKQLPDSFRSGSFVRTWPHRHDVDAFFAACLAAR